MSQVIDPVGGSYYVEALTRDFEARIQEILAEVDELGGTLRAIELGWFQREIADFAYDFAKRKSDGTRVVVGVNKYTDDADDQQIEVHQLDERSEQRKVEQLAEIRRQRDERCVEAALDALVAAARDPDANVMPPTIEAVKARASMGEIVETLEGLFGRYSETPRF